MISDGSVFLWQPLAHQTAWRPSPGELRAYFAGPPNIKHLLLVSADTVYDLFAKGELPGRKVGRKWITTKAAVLRWIENTSTEDDTDTLVRRIQSGDGNALARAMNKGKVRIRAKG